MERNSCDYDNLISLWDIESFSSERDKADEIVLYSTDIRTQEIYVWAHNAIFQKIYGDVNSCSLNFRATASK